MGDRLDLVHEQPEAGAEIDQARVESRPRWRIEDEADRIFLAADRERVNLERRLGGGDRRTDFEHVRAQNLMPIGREMVGVVLHERCAAGQPFAHDLHRPHERGGLPVALGAKAVTIRHQPLRSEPRKLPKPMQVLEGRREAVEPASLEERAQSELEPGAVKERLVTLAASAQFGRDLVSLLVFAGQGLRFPVRNGADRVRQFADAIAVGGEAELHLGRHLVAFGHRDLAHVVAEAAEFRTLPVVPCARGPHPGADPILNLRVRPMADDHLTAEPHARVDEARLAVAVRRLVQVHEVHVDRRPRQIATELGVEMQERLPKRVEPAHPHL